MMSGGQQFPDLRIRGLAEIIIPLTDRAEMHFTASEDADVTV